MKTKVLRFLTIYIFLTNLPAFESESNIDPLPIYKACQAFYSQYIELAMNFTDCELKNSSPFRLCTKCLSEYTKASKTFEDLFVSIFFMNI